jgi:hypothetical protein
VVKKWKAKSLEPKSAKISKAEKLSAEAEALIARAKAAKAAAREARREEKRHVRRGQNRRKYLLGWAISAVVPVAEPDGPELVRKLATWAIAQGMTVERLRAL